MLEKVGALEIFVMLIFSTKKLAKTSGSLPAVLGIIVLQSRSLWNGIQRMACCLGIGN